MQSDLHLPRRLGLVPAVALLLSVVLLALAAATIAGDRTRADAALAQRLQSRAQAEAAAISAAFSRARDVALLTAWNPAFKAFYADPRPRQERIRSGVPLAEATAAMRYLEQLYPDAIGEACFIDASGAENARVVRGRSATVAELSASEAHNIFFAPTMALAPGQVYLAQPYVSPDTAEWVISISTPIVAGNGDKVGMVHYELTIESFRRHVEQVVGKGIHIDLVEVTSGKVILDAQTPQRPRTLLGEEPDPAYRAFAGNVAGMASVHGERLAYRRVDRSPGNANHWYVVAGEPSLGFTDTIGVVPVLYAGVAALLLALAAVLARASRRRELAELERALGAQQEAEERSRTDALTGLLNRRGCVEALTVELRRAEREGHTPAVLLIDADRFKPINDTYGHQAGDHVLVEIGRRLRTAVREYDIVARWGGEEFCVVIPAVGRDDDLHAIGDALRRAISVAPFDAGVGAELPVTVSVGAVRASDSLWSVEGIIDAADRALYAAKRRGRDLVRLFTEMTVEDFVAEEPEALRLAQALALSAAIREGMPEAHSQQVADLSGAIAEQLALSDGLVMRCRVGGWLHDIGKVAIPDSVLAKPGPLTDEEWTTMRTHTAIGEQLIRRVAGLSDAAPAVRHHHERWDGTGYPDCLAGEDIPLEARIVAVADAYSAITSDRVYQTRRGEDEAISELRRSAGSHLDPLVVEAAVTVLMAQTREVERRR